jgi:hypothetical protein
VLDERPGAAALSGGVLILGALVVNTALEHVRPRLTAGWERRRRA